MFVSVGMPAEDGIGLGPVDLLALLAYFGLLAVIAWRARPRGNTTDDYFLAGRSIPAWAAACSFMATALSAATFLGAPQEGYQVGLTYLVANLAAIVGIAVVIMLFIPAFYRAGVTTVYGYLRLRFGTSASVGAGVTFLIGRLLASGARLYIAAIALAFLVNPTAEQSMWLPCLMVVVLVLAAMAYVTIGGIRSVIWTDVCQTAVFVGAAIAVIVLILQRIPADLSSVVSALHAGGEDGVSRFTLAPGGFFDISRTEPFSLPAIIFGLSLINLGAYGTDQDLAQRLLTCRDAKQGARSAMLAITFAIPVTLLFLVVGMLLWVFYSQPELMGDAAPPEPAVANKYIFLVFIVEQLPAGLAGLISAGLLATAVSSLTSELNALSATAVSDCYVVFRPESSEAQRMRMARFGIVAAGLGLALVAVLCLYWQKDSDESLIRFALRVMGYAYAGLVGVYLCALTTRRGNARSAMLALIVGFAAECFWTFGPFAGELAFTWVMLWSTAAAFLCCFLGTPTAAAGAVADGSGSRPVGGLDAD